MKKSLQYPLLLVSKSDDVIQNFVKKYASQHAFHPSDVITIYKDPNVISIDQIRDIQKILSRSGNRKLIVIHDFQTAKKETQNAMLKLLEESGEIAQFIMIVPDTTSVLPTIRSRALIHKLSEKNTDERYSTPFLVEFGLLEKGITLASMLHSTAVLKKEQTAQFLDEILFLVRSEEVSRIGPIVEEILQTKRLIIENNMNAEFARDHIICYAFKHGVFPWKH